MVLFAGSAVRPIAPADAAPRHASALSASAVIDLALAPLPGPSQPQAARLADVLGPRGIAHAWQLAALRDSELAELVIDNAGWNLGELMALRVALAHTPAVPPMPLPDVTDDDTADTTGGGRSLPVAAGARR